MNILFICSPSHWGENEKWVSLAMQGLSRKHNVYFLGTKKELLVNLTQLKNLFYSLLVFAMNGTVDFSQRDRKMTFSIEKADVPNER